MPTLESTGIFLVTNKGDVKNQIAASDSPIKDVYQVTGNLYDEKAILMELWTREELKEGEVIVCVSGVEFEDMAYRISVNAIPWDLYHESRILNYQVPRDIDLEILSRVIFLALELAREGREGKPVGTLFVLGDFDKIKPYCKQLIINPFGGLDEQSRSILDPSLSETIKEYAKIDGAFIIGSDGLIHSAGTYLSIPPNKVELASGLGARHAAAMGITLVAPVVSVVISESTKNIRVYWHGTEQDIYIS
jgi:DNA integrity scanning protein DisA with diadenylate cyclase activity